MDFKKTSKKICKVLDKIGTKEANEEIQHRCQVLQYRKSDWDRQRFFRHRMTENRGPSLTVS
jgi:hypothetical protein